MTRRSGGHSGRGVCRFRSSQCRAECAAFWHEENFPDQGQALECNNYETTTSPEGVFITEVTESHTEHEEYNLLYCAGPPIRCKEEQRRPLA